MPIKRKDMTGNIYGRLMVIEMLPNSKSKCRCECGTIKVVADSDLRSGNTQSCGCLRKERISAAITTHGQYGSKDYRRWHGMISRCHFPGSRSYVNYGARGITVCDRWRGRSGFQNFMADMGTPHEGMSLERIDNNAGYSPENCRWATSSDQGRNRRSNHLIEFSGEKKTMSEWAQRFGMRVGTLSERLRHGWPIERALSEPLQQPSEAH